MKKNLYAPAYYERFACIADACRHSCCIGWEIDVDRTTMAKYASSSHPYARTVLQSIVGDNTPHFQMGKDGRCPHLDACGLCNVITHMGEGHLCHICREHPRFYHDTPRGKEVGLGMCCEEACRLILTADDFDRFVAIEKTDAGEKTGFDVIPMREKIYRTLSRSDLSYRQKREEIYETFGVAPSLLTNEAWRAVLAELEYLDENHRALFEWYDFCSATDARWEPCLVRALAYYVFRHMAETETEEAAKTALVLALFLERLLASVVVAARPNSFGELAELARALSEEIEYSEDNIAALRFEIFSAI